MQGEILETRALLTSFGFANDIGGSGIDEGKAIAQDSLGNVYVTGYFAQTVNFNPSGSTTETANSGSSNVYVAKYSPTGALDWVDAMGGASYSGLAQGLGIAVNPTDNSVYVTGKFSGSSFDAGSISGNPTNLSAQGNQDIFVAKFDASGNLGWAEDIGGTGTDLGTSIAVNPGGNTIYVAGTFSGSANFNPGGSGGTLTSNGVAINEAFVAAYSVTTSGTSPTFQWADGFGGLSTDEATGVVASSDGSVYATGWFDGTVNFNPNSAGTADNVASHGGDDAFIEKLNSGGTFQWAQTFGGTSGDQGTGITVSSDGSSIYATGYFQGSGVQFGSSAITLNSQGNQDVYVARLSSSGSFTWADSIGGASTDIGYAIALDANNNVYTTGQFTGTVDFNPNSATPAFDLTSRGDHDIFVSELNSSGSFLTARQAGGVNATDDLGDGILVLNASGNANNGDIYTTGFFSGTTDFDPFTPILPADFITSNGIDDAFLAEFNVFAAPTTSGIANVNVPENSPSTVINLANSFASTLQSSPSLSYVITSDSNSSLFSSTAISSGNLTLAYALSIIGTSSLTVQATDALGQSISTSFSVTVTAGSSNVSGTTLTISGHLGDVTTITFSDANDFSVVVNGGTPTNYSLSNITQVNYDGPSGQASEVIFSDTIAGDKYSATQSLTNTTLVRSGFEFDATGASTLYSYSNGTSTANVTVTAGSGSNYFVGVMGAGTSNYSYLADPILGTFSELSGFDTETVSGTTSTTYAYVYSTSHATLVGDPSSSTFSLDGNTSTLSHFSQEYLVGAADGTDSVTLHSAGGSFVGTPQFSYVSGTANGSSFLIGALYVATLTTQASSTTDTAVYYSYANNTFTGTSGASSIGGSTTNVAGTSRNFVTQANGYSQVSVFESGSGTDIANLTSPGNGSFFGTSTADTLTIGTSSITVNTYFVNQSSQIVAVPSQVNVTGNHDGTDQATIVDSTGTNALTASGSTAKLSTSADTITINKFGSVVAEQQNGSSDTVHKGVIDFTLTTVGNWISD